MFCEPPSIRTEPMSTFTRRFLAAASEPLISWVQLPPSRNTRDCWAMLRGRSASTTATNLEIVSKVPSVSHPQPIELLPYIEDLMTPSLRFGSGPCPLVPLEFH